MSFECQIFVTFSKAYSWKLTKNREKNTSSMISTLTFIDSPSKIFSVFKKNKDRCCYLLSESGVMVLCTLPFHGLFFEIHEIFTRALFFRGFHFSRIYFFFLMSAWKVKTLDSANRICLFGHFCVNLAFHFSRAHFSRDHAWDSRKK